MFRTGRIAALAVAALLVASCGGDDSSSTTTQAPTAPEETAPETTTDVPEETTPEGGDDWEPGDVAFRAVNLLDEPVDVYVRTTGFVVASPVTMGLAPGEVTDFVAPPTQGVFLVTTAGAGDPECVGTCDHFIVNYTATEVEGPNRTIVLYDDSGTPRGLDLWENPTDEAMQDTSNSMPPADPDTGLVVVTAIALTDADFGLLMSYDGVDGCQEPVNVDNVLIGGTQTPAFAIDGETEVYLHSNTDRECTEEPVGGPFTVTAGADTRTHLILDGSPGDMTATVLPMADGDLPVTGGGEASGDDRQTAIDLLAADAEESIGLSADDAACLAETLVDAIGADVLLDDSGELIDPELLPEDEQVALEDALIASAEACGIDVG
jgi:hypothetical protein